MREGLWFGVEKEGTASIFSLNFYLYQHGRANVALDNLYLSP